MRTYLAGESKQVLHKKVFFVLGGLRKKSLARCQILRSKFFLYTIQQKVFFNITKDSFKSYRSYVRVKSQNMFLGRKNFCSEWSEKQVLSTMSGFALKILSLNSLTKSCFRYSEGLIQIIWVPMKVSENPYMFYGRRIFCSRWSEKKKLSTLSDFALKKLSLNSLTKSFFRYSEGLIQIIWVPMKVS